MDFFCEVLLIVCVIIMLKLLFLFSDIILSVTHEPMLIIILERKRE